MVAQKRFADYGNAAGTLESLVTLHQNLQKQLSAFGYKLTICNLFVKERFLEKSKQSFESLDIKIVPEHRMLGSKIGSEARVQRIQRKCHH